MGSELQRGRKKLGLILVAVFMLIGSFAFALFNFIDSNVPLTWASFLKHFPLQFSIALLCGVGMLICILVMARLTKPLDKYFGNIDFHIEEASYDVNIDALRHHPMRLQTLEGAFAKICIIRTLRSDGDGGGESLYTSFGVTHSGEICTIEEDMHDEYILDRAGWLAQALQIPLEDTSYGTDS